MNTPIQDRTEIRLKNANDYVAEFFPDLPETSRMLLADCLVKALFPTDPDSQKQVGKLIP